MFGFAKSMAIWSTAAAPLIHISLDLDLFYIYNAYYFDGIIN